MKWKFNGKKYKIKPEYWKREDDLNVNLPSYTIIYGGMNYYERKWEKCQFAIHGNFKEMKVFVSPVGTYIKTYNGGMSNIGKVDSQGFADIIELSPIKSFLIYIYLSTFNLKVFFKNLIDRIKLIKKNLHYILFALFGSIIYYLINHFYDGFLQELINKNNFVQSIIVFVSLSSLVNIFYPFTLRKEWTINEINALISKKLLIAEKDLERKKQIEKRYR